MPYAPGAQDISGQLYAQGIERFGQGIAQGIQDYQKNKILNTSSIAKFESLAQANPEILQFLGGEGAQSEAGKAFDKLRNNGSVSLRDAAALHQFADTAATQKQAKVVQAHIAAQTAAEQAQVDAIAGQAKLRDLDAELKRRQLDMMDGVMNGKFGPPPAQKDLANRDPDFAPASAPPTYQDALIEAFQSGVVDPAKATEVAKDIYNKRYDSWKGGTAMHGVVPGAKGFDSEGQPTQDWHFIVRKNDGSIERTTTPIKTFANQAPPGRLLDEKTFKPIDVGTLVNTGVPGQPVAVRPGVAPVPLPPKSLEEIGNTQADLLAIQTGLESLERMKAINAEMGKKRWDRLAGITGQSVFNNVIEPALGDSTGQLFDAEGAKFKADVMKESKNVRNMYEFKSITGDVPVSAQTSATRAALIATKEDKLKELLMINKTRLELLKAGVVPADAHDQAVAMVTGTRPERKKIADAPEVKPETPVTPKTFKQGRFTVEVNP